MPDGKIKITPALIPHSQFHKGNWSLSVKRPLWYYFMENENRNDTIHNKNFMESVDAPLKELVSFLHSLGIKTTPSCAGHHKSEKDFERIYKVLKVDEEEIRSTGLKLEDIESGKEHLYKNKNYSLPWSKEIFIRKILKYQGNGIIGIKTNHQKNDILQLRIPGVKITEKDSIIFIHTKEPLTETVFEKWKVITAEVKNIFDRVDIVKRLFFDRLSDQYARTSEKHASEQVRQIFAVF